MIISYHNNKNLLYLKHAEADKGGVMEFLDETLGPMGAFFADDKSTIILMVVMLNGHALMLKFQPFSLSNVFFLNR